MMVNNVRGIIPIWWPKDVQVSECAIICPEMFLMLGILVGIPARYLWWWIGDGLWHCYTNIPGNMVGTASTCCDFGWEKAFWTLKNHSGMSAYHQISLIFQYPFPPSVAVFLGGPVSQLHRHPWMLLLKDMASCLRTAHPWFPPNPFVDHLVGGLEHFLFFH